MGLMIRIQTDLKVRAGTHHNIRQVEEGEMVVVDKEGPEVEVADQTKTYPTTVATLILVATFESAQKLQV